MTEQKISFMNWMKLIDETLLAAQGESLADVARFVPPSSLFQLWKLNMPMQKVVGWVAMKVAAADLPVDR